MTATASMSSIRVRPQPVGIYPPPVSFLLLPDMDDQDALSALMSGDSKALARGAWRFYRLALEGYLDEALAAIEGDGIIERWNRFILQPDAAAFELLRHDVPPDMMPLLEAMGFASGLTQVAPSADSLDGELRALVLLTAATSAIEHEEHSKAIALLEEALDSAREPSPLLAAQILHQIGSLERVESPAKAVARYKDAIQLAGETPLVSLRAELWLNIGMSWQEAGEGRRGPLLEAAKAYQEAIRCGNLSVDELPELYALAQNNLALTYLTIPTRDASDQLRMGIAVQCLREALKVYHRDTHPEMWSSAQLNLANALQYLPTSHPEENLQQAVNLYEELLEVRNRALDPLGYARLLANQANALAHLGIFKPALEKLNEAHKLFHWHGEPQMAASVLELVSNVNLKIEEANR